MTWPAQPAGPPARGPSDQRVPGAPGEGVPGGPAPARPGPAGAWAASTGPDTGWLRLSPRSLIVRPVTDLARLLPFLLGLLYLHARGGPANYWGLAFAALAVTTSVVRWLTTRYRITGDRVYLRHGLLSQKVLSVARDRVRTVDLSAHVVYRMLGLREVSIGTGRNDRRDSAGFRLDALTLADAEALRTRLLAGPTASLPPSPGPAATAGRPGAARGAGPAGAGPSPGPAPVADPGSWPGTAAAAGSRNGARPPGYAAVPATAEQETEIVRLRPGWVRFAPLTLTGMVIVGVVFGFAAQFTDATHINVTSIGEVHRITADFIALPLASRLLAGALIVIGGMVAISTAGYVAIFWNFRLVRQGPGTLRVTRGLLSTRAITIDASRLRGVEISEPLLLRAARGARCIAITTGLHVGHGAERGGSLLLPPAPRPVARSVAAEVSGAPADLFAGPLVRHGRRARLRRYNRALAGAAVLVAVAAAGAAVSGWPPWTPLAAAAALPAAAALAEDRYRNLGHRVQDGWVVMSTGSLVRRRSVLSADGIIGWRVHQSWFQRRQGLVTLTATTAAGRQEYAVHD
ncbi:MAG: PH domain-containing protein, partial [Streptosporangiaceae bacterium]